MNYYTEAFDGQLDKIEICRRRAPYIRNQKAPPAGAFLCPAY